MRQPLISLQTETEEKRSRFISRIAPVDCEQSVRDLLALAWLQHPKASHICWAFRLQAHTTGNTDDERTSQLQEGYSDDGEPSGTAGMPILKQLRHDDLVNCVLLVIRYYGGTKLGTGGLQRAYSRSAQEVLTQLSDDQCEHLIRRERITIFCDFSEEAHIRYLIDRYGCVLISSQYDQRGVNIVVDIAEGDNRLKQDILVRAGVYFDE